ncbi:MAG TPA: glycosyltransferase family 4 protein [bacterium]|nr:glycosyltransferase family 4 protein [bacterium]HQM52122.1 glycosyltransferase family 4 protein [bacterium]
MKLLCISRKHPPSVGGMQAMNQALISRLARDTDATVVAWGGSQWFLPFFLAWALLRSLALLPPRRRPDAVYLGDALLAPFGLLLKRLLRRPVAVTAHGRDITFRFPLYRTVVGSALRRLDRVASVSRHTDGLCAATGVPAERRRIIPNGVDPDAHRAGPADREAALRWLAGRGIDRSRPMLLTVGRLVKRKGVARFVGEALPALARLHPDVLLIVVGEGRERASIERRIAEREMERHALLAGALPPELLRGLAGVASVFVMPNIPVEGDAEGFGLVALEAGCAGLPVAASDLEGIRDAIVPGMNGALIRWDDTEGFVSTVAALLADAGRRAAAGEAARRFNRERFSWDEAARRYLAMLESLASGAAPPPAAEA